MNIYTNTCHITKTKNLRLANKINTAVVHIISLLGEATYYLTEVETEAESGAAVRREQMAVSRAFPHKATELSIPGPSSSHGLCAKLNIITNITCIQRFTAM